MRGAVKTGGGQIVGGAYLGSGATHVVCHPQAAVKWLAMGMLTTWHCIHGGSARVIMLYAPQHADQTAAALHVQSLMCRIVLSPCDPRPAAVCLRYQKRIVQSVTDFCDCLKPARHLLNWHAAYMVMCTSHDTAAQGM